MLPILLGGYELRGLIAIIMATIGISVKTYGCKMPAAQGRLGKFMTDSTAEFEENPEYAAELRHRAVIEYMGTSPQVRLGEMPEENLLRWQEALDTSTQNPTELWVSGWVDAELAARHTLIEEGEDATEVIRAIDALLDRAQTKFEQTRDHKSLQPISLLRSQATLAAPAMAVWAAMVTGRDVRPAERRYGAAQAASAQRLLDYFAENPTVEASMWADSLTFISIILMRGEMMALPCPPRLSSPYIDSHYRQSAIVFVDESFYDVRVGSPGHSEFLHIPYEALGHEKRAQHKLGTLHAMMQLEEAAVMLRGKPPSSVPRSSLTKYLQAETHSQEVYDVIAALIAAEKVRPQKPLQVPEDPLAWVHWLQAGRNPYFVDPERTDAAISPLELQVADETITSAAALELGWLYAEVAFGRAVDPTVPKVRVQGDIDRAEEIFSIALEKADEQNIRELCEASLAHSSAWMQRVVLCNEELRSEDIDYYRQMLVYVGRRASARYAELPPGSPEAVELAALMHRTTLCLLTMSEGEDIVAVVTPPRQRKQDGWDVTVWVRSLSGFIPLEYGRLRITEKEDKSSLSDGIVTVTTQQLGELKKVGTQKQAPFRVFQALADRYEDAPLPRGTKPQERQATIQKAWKVIEPRIAATAIV